MRALCFAVAILGSTSLAFGQDIPRRYSGPFPNAALARNIVGTYAGARLALRYQFMGTLASTAAYTCARAAPTLTRCRGTWRAGGRSGPSTVDVAWRRGRPVAVFFW